MARHTSTLVDPRILSQPFHTIARQTPAQRLHIHGPIKPMHDGRGFCAKLFNR